MSLIVQKFGGSSVADANKLRNVARIITDTYQRGNDVVVVLSAQGDERDAERAVQAVHDRFFSEFGSNG